MREKREKDGDLHGHASDAQNKDKVTGLDWYRSIKCIIGCYSCTATHYDELESVRWY